MAPPLALIIEKLSDLDLMLNTSAKLKLDARLEVVRGSWKDSQKSFPASVQADVHLNVRPAMGGQYQQTRLSVEAPSEPN
jgi:hypothetical protein